MDEQRGGWIDAWTDRLITVHVSKNISLAGEKKNTDFVTPVSCRDIKSHVCIVVTRAITKWDEHPPTLQQLLAKKLLLITKY